MDLTPRPEHRFSFGLWGVAHPGHDPFGVGTRAPLDLAEATRRLGDLGAWGVGFHDDDVFPPDASADERRAAVDKLCRAAEQAGVTFSMATTNLFTHPVFKDGAFTANDPDVRRYALAKALRNIDLAGELGVRNYIFWGGREGVEAPAAKDPRDALDRYREAIDFLAGYVKDRGYPMRFALEPKPNEPRGDTFLPTVGHMLAFIDTLDNGDIVGVNPEVAHELMAGLSFYHAVAQALWAGKLFHIDLNAQKPTRYDQDLRFGSEGIKDTFFTVMLLERSGYDGPRHFDARPYRVEDPDGVWEFARGCMRTYLIFAAKAQAFAADHDISAALDAAGAPQLAVPTVGAYDHAEATRLRDAEYDPDQLASRGYANERLDQLTIDLLLGA